MLVDTGASKTLLDSTTWKRISQPGTKVSAADVSLLGANGALLVVYLAENKTFEL